MAAKNGRFQRSASFSIRAGRAPVLVRARVARANDPADLCLERFSGRVEVKVSLKTGRGNFVDKTLGRYRETVGDALWPRSGKSTCCGRASDKFVRQAYPPTRLRGHLAEGCSSKRSPIENTVESLKLRINNQGAQGNARTSTRSSPWSASKGPIHDISAGQRRAPPKPRANRAT